MNAQLKRVLRVIAYCVIGSGLIIASQAPAQVQAPGQAPGQAGSQVPALTAARYAALNEQAEAEGAVRVIVQLSDRIVPQRAGGQSAGHAIGLGNLSAERLAERKAAVATAQQSFVTRHNLAQHQVGRFSMFPFVVVDADPALLEELAASPDVVDVSADDFNEAHLASTRSVIGANTAHNLGWDGTGYDVAIIDTGVQASHPMLSANVQDDLAACFSRPLFSYDYSLCPGGLPACTDADGDPLPHSACGSGAAEPCGGLCGHGTHVAGIAAGNGSETGVAPGAGIIPINVFIGRDTDDDGDYDFVGAYDSDIIRGLEYVLQLSATRNIAAVNMSLGGGVFSSTASCDSWESAIKSVVDALRSAGVATVVSAGNNGSSSGLSAPGCISTVISVGSTNDSDWISGFSNESPALTLHAPGENVTSAYPWSTYARLGGTSMASPHVAGAIAVFREKTAASGLDASVDTVVAALQQTGSEMFGGDFKVPRIDVASALGLLDDQIPVTVILDDQLSRDQVQVTAGSATSVESRFAYGGEALRGDMAGANRIRFTPDLPQDGYYRLSLMWPVYGEAGSAVEVDVVSAGGSDVLVVDQTADGGLWQELGAYRFDAGNSGYVELSDAAGGRVLADALRFERIGAAVPQVHTSALPVGWQGARYSVQLKASGGFSPYAWTAQGLPGGLSLDPTTGVIDGMPMESGTFMVDIALTDQNGDAATAALALEVRDADSYPSSVNVNFQTTASALPSGYEPDYGDVFGERSNGLSYGWSADNTASARDRDDPDAPDQRYDTLSHFALNGDFDWRLSLPNGEYTVRLVAGDPTYFEGLRQKLLVEGMVAVDQTLGGSTRWADETVAVTVTDGELNIAAAANAIGPKLMFVEVERVQSGPGNTAPTVAITSPGDGASYEEGDAVALEADAADSDGSVALVEFYADGQKLGEDATAPYSLLWSDVSAGSHTLTAVATDDEGATAVSEEVSLSVTGPFPAVVKVNFQPAGSAVPSGYEPDYGDVFADRGNGLSYGWSADNAASARDRDHPTAPDQRYDTLTHVEQYGSVDWELELPNGQYQVRVLAGDPTYYEGKKQLVIVEGQTAIEAMLGGTVRWVDETATVTVSDGRLTISSDPTAPATKLLFVEVASVD